MKYPIALYPYEEGGCVAEVLMLKGCLAQGETLSIKTLTTVAHPGATLYRIFGFPHLNRNTLYSVP
jgi:hypothetical protein